MTGNRDWMFRVSCLLGPEETVCVAGSSDSLGAWDSQRMVTLHPECTLLEEGECIWSASIQVPLSEVEYRYCVCVVLEAGPRCPERTLVVRRWEAYPWPRKICAGETCPTEPQAEVFGACGGRARGALGWLVRDSAVQLRLCNSALYSDPVKLFKEEHHRKKVRVRMTPVDLELIGESPLACDSGAAMDENTDADPSNLRLPDTKPTWTRMEVAVLDGERCKFQPQEQCGVVCNTGDHTIFQCRVLQPNSIAFLCEFYTKDGEEDPSYLGCSYVLPSNLKDSCGVTTLPITSPKNILVGQLTVHYLVVYPMETGGGDMSVSYIHYWKDNWKCLEVGHRGSGNSFLPQPESCAIIRENTIASFKQAAEKGADMVEFDVQVSQDLVPIIYHDFHACLALTRKNEESDDLHEIPIKDLTLSQMQSLKIYHKQEKGVSKFHDEELEDHHPFPTLQKALETVPESCGFNVEVKWTMQMKDGTCDLQHPLEPNHYLDLIIKVVLKHSGKRKIVFSCFHPDICTMLRLKQNRYPVLFLTKAWQPLEDQRATSLHQAVQFAISADILGINVHTEVLIGDPIQASRALDRNLIVFCYGDQNTDRDQINFLRRLGLHGIIYDRIGESDMKAK